MRKLAVVLVAAAALACGTSKKAQKPIAVSDSDFGRLQPGQTQVVDAARADLARARDDLARATLRHTESSHEEQLARADLTAAEASRVRADAQSKAAKESNDPAQLELARSMTEDAQLRRRAAEARLEFAKRLMLSRNADLQAAQQRVAYEEARVEQSKLQALQTAKIPAAAKYQPSQLEARVAAARRDLEAAENRARTAQAEAVNAQRSWQELDRQLQARGGAPGTRG